MVKDKKNNTGEPLDPRTEERSKVDVVSLGALMGDKPETKENEAVPKAVLPEIPAEEIYEEPEVYEDSGLTEDRETDAVDVSAPVPEEETDDVLPLPDGMEDLLAGKAPDADDFFLVEENDEDEATVYADFTIAGERKPQEPTPDYILTHDKTAADALLDEDFGAAEVPELPLEAEESTEDAGGEDLSVYAPLEEEEKADLAGFAALFSRKKKPKSAKTPAPDRTITEELAFVTDSLPKKKVPVPEAAKPEGPADAVPAADVVPETEKAPETMPEKQPEEMAAARTPVRTAGSGPDPMKKHIISMVASLTIICGVIALLLSAVNAVTKDVIAENVTKRQSEAILRVFPEGTDVAQYVGNDKVYLVYKDGNVIGYCASVEPVGYKDGIGMMVGVDLDGVVSGIQIVEMSETSGVGTKVKAESFLGQFFGFAGPFAVGDNVDGVVGATISSKAVTEGVNMALDMIAGVDLRYVPVKNETTTETEIEPSVETEPVPVETETEPQLPETETETEIPAPETETKAPETIPPETIPPETRPPETRPPETQPPETTPPETQAPETQPPETQAPETQPPETTPPETQAPETEPVTETETMPPETESESAETEVEPETETTASETEPETETTVPETESETEAEITPPESEPETVETAPETEPETETESESETASGTESGSDGDAESASDTGTAEPVEEPV